MLNVASDQAAGLRRMARGDTVRVIAVTSGKGGAGKTNVSVNLALALAGRGKSVMLMDADLGLGNVDVLLGLHPRHNLSHVVEGKCTLEEIIVHGPRDVKLVPAASGSAGMSDLSMAEHAGLIRAFGDLDSQVDTLLVDTAAGASQSVTTFARAAQDIIVVVCDEPASITDAYALIKILHRDCGCHRFRILANMTRSAAEAKALFVKLLKVSDRFLSVSLDYLGAIPYDEQILRAVQRQQAVVDAFPQSRAALAFTKLATATDNWPVPDEASGHLGFFVERLIEASQGTMEVQV